MSVTSFRLIITNRELPERNRVILRLQPSGEAQVFVDRPELTPDLEQVVRELCVLLSKGAEEGDL